MANYAKPQGRDTNGEVVFESPSPYPALVSWQRENAVASSVISLNPNTTFVEVSSAGGTGLVIRWIPVTETAGVGAKGSVTASGAAANFDHFIPAGQIVRRFIVPRETSGQTAGGQVGSVNGLYQRLAWINAASSASSILANEY